MSTVLRLVGRAVMRPSASPNHVTIRRALGVLGSLATIGLASLLLSGARPAPRAKAPARPPAKSGWQGSTAERRVDQATEALAQGHVDEARTWIGMIPVGSPPSGREDDVAFLRAILASDGNEHAAALEEYMRAYPKGKHRREAALALSRAHYARGEYSEAANLLSIFSPGVEKDFIGRQALIQCGLAQLAQGDAPGALQFLRSADADFAGSPQEEAYFFALAEAALRANKPADAGEALRRLLERHAKGDYGPQALYALALSMETVGRTGDAAGVFRQIMVRFPASYEAARVRDRGIRLTPAPESPLLLGGGYAVQVGAFSRRDLADALARDLKTAGVEDVSVKQGTETPPVYRVRAGSFSTREEARALGERFRRERGFSFTVVPR